MSNVFEKFAKKFQTCQAGDDFVAEEIMAQSGRAFYEAIHSGRLFLGKIPKWFYEEPIGRQIYPTRNGDSSEVSVLYWCTYWWCAVEWLSFNRSDSGIVLPVTLGRSHPEKCVAFFARMELSLLMLVSLTKENLLKVWPDILKACLDACNFLANTKPELDENRRHVRATDGNWYAVTVVQMAMLQGLFQADGAWITSEAFDCNRADKIRKAMPDAVKSMIQTHKQHGYRIPALLPYLES